MIWALHGFLGQPCDWNELRQNVHEPVEAVDLSMVILGFSSPSSVKGSFKDAFKESFREWTRAFNQMVAARQCERNILMGYSMGGRLALHALIENPTLYERTLLISTHPGLESEELKKERLKSDNRWAEKFLKDPWPQLLSDWESQEVFKNSNSLERNETDFSRESLALQLTQWSLGLQEDLREQIPHSPLLWMVGELDLKFAQIGVELSERAQENQMFHLCQIPSAGHRLPWDQPKAFFKEVNSWIT